MIDRATSGLPYLTFATHDRHPEVTCFVTTRSGGDSVGPLGTLNLSMAVGDDEQVVRANRARLSAITGCPPGDLTLGSQVHSARVEAVDSSTRGRTFADTDALVTDCPDTPLLVLVADCAAVALYDPRHGAAGIAHAGWRGTMEGIAVRTLAVMAQRYGTDPADVVAAISPAIGPCCYDVGPDVCGAFRSRYPRIADDILSAPDGTRTGASASGAPERITLDLAGANARQLEGAGVDPRRIEPSGRCTSCDTRTFYSHRAEHGRTGRFCSVIMVHGRTQRAY